MDRKLIYIFFLFLQLLSCTNLDDIEERVSKLESQEETNQLNDSVIPKLESITFLASENSLLLINDIHSEEINDSIVECWIPHLMLSKILRPVLDYVGDSVYVDGVKYGGGNVDFRKPVDISVFLNEKIAKYVVYVYSFTGLPVMWIETDGRKDVNTKEYQSATVKVVENVVTRGAGDITEGEAQIKCRGNTSFLYTDKKSFTIKFDKKISLFDQPKDKSYVLIANAFDKTKIRNVLGYYMGSISEMEYSPKWHYIDVFLNGKYHGLYLLVDKLKIAEHRVNVGSDGFLLEVDQRAVGENDIYFTTENLPQPVNIKDPDVEVGDENYNYIMNFVRNAESVLFSDIFMDKDEGWQKYIDIETFADWYIIEEIAENGDARYYTSCFMNLKRGDKLKMGPVWDFDVTFGNNKHYYSTNGFLANDTKWMRRLLEDPAFKEKVKERFQHFYSRKEDLLTFINSQANYIRRSVVEDDYKWDVLYNHDQLFHYDVLGKYENEVTWLKEWLFKRLEWMKYAYENDMFTNEISD